MYTKIIGHDVEMNARSPLIWNQLYKKLGINCQMLRKNTSQEEFEKEIRGCLLDPEFRGMLLAAPLKEIIFDLANLLGFRVDGSIKSINVIHKTVSGFAATSTDGYGALASLELADAKCNFLILGYGGTSKSIINAIVQNTQYGKLVVATRELNIHSENQLVQFISYKEINHFMRDTNVLINATVLGNPTYPSKSPLTLDSMRNCESNTVILDVNYNSTGTTGFIENARLVGLDGIDGRRMNLMQALCAFGLVHSEIKLTVNELANLVSI
jgi:shikimate 5-dehydrogenase